MTRPTETDIQFQDGLQMIFDLARDIAKQKGITEISMQLDDGRPHCCIDVHVLDISSEGNMVSTKLNQEEIEDYPGHAGIDLTQAKIKGAIERLMLMLE